MSEAAAGGGRSIAPRRHWFLNPYVQIGVASLLVTASEVLLKVGAEAAPMLPGFSGWFGIAPLASAWTWAGIFLYVIGLFSWLYVLRHVPINIAFSLLNGVQVLVPLAAWWLLGEAVTPRRWLGIALVMIGILLIARTIKHVEERS